MTAPASLAFTCDTCRARFTANDGGICDACGRTLCGLHLYGMVSGWLLPWRLWFPGRATCRACRPSGETGPRDGDPG